MRPLSDLVDVIFDDLFVHEVVEFIEKVNDVDWEAVGSDVVEVGDVAEEHRRRIKLLRADLRDKTPVILSRTYKGPRTRT